MPLPKKLARKVNNLDITDKVWGAAIVALLLYEGYTLINNREGDTLSEGVWEIATKRPLVPFAAGFTMGHFFWQAYRNNVVHRSQLIDLGNECYEIIDG